MEPGIQRARGPSFLACCLRAPKVDDEHLAEATLQPTSDYIGWKSQSPFVTSVTAHAVAKDVADASADVAMPHGDKHIIAAKRKSVDQAALTPQHSLTVHDMPNLKPLMALTLNRPYTDKDWFAAMAALDKVQKLQQQRALQQLRASNRCSTASFLHVDDENDVWFDARSHVVSDSSVAFISDAEREEVAKLAHELEQQEQHQQQLTVSIICELEPCNPSCVPDPPLLCAEKHWKYCQVDIKPFCFYWERDPVRSTPFPLPIDEQMKLNHLFQKTHQSIPGMWMREVGQQLLLHATPDLAVLPGVVNYTEYYNKDSSPCSWTLRRDIKIGRTTGQMFMTTDGVLIFRVVTTGMFSKAVEWIGEDYIRLEDNGETIVTRQLCKMMCDKSVQSQYLIGRKIGTQPPRRPSLMGQ